MACVHVLGIIFPRDADGNYNLPSGAELDAAQHENDRMHNETWSTIRCVLENECGLYADVIGVLRDFVNSCNSCRHKKTH